MNLGGWILWGFVATVVLTIVLSGSQAAGLTRMNTPYLLGTMFTADRERAKLYGALWHFVNGWLFSGIYVAAFHSWGRATLGLGSLIGLVHGAFVIVALMPLFPALHPRMASETQGVDDVRQLEPPGWFGLHYGVRTPLSILIAHVVYGAILGAFYRF